MRLNWEYQPSSQFFVVYSDGRDTLGPGMPTLLNRSFAGKITRLLRFQSGFGIRIWIRHQEHQLSSASLVSRSLDMERVLKRIPCGGFSTCIDSSQHL